MSNASEFFQQTYAHLQSSFEAHAKKRFSEKSAELALFMEAESHDRSYQKLVASMEYSFFNGGKRFRPVVGLGLAGLLKTSDESVLPWLMAVEMIHTYSLIHDDLPCMDDDDERRGQPTNHIRFDEATALLAGDALLTDAFGEVTQVSNMNAIPELIKILSRQAGLYGMITGQIMDIQFEDRETSLISSDQDARVLKQIHHLKTAQLIQLVCEGIAVLAHHQDIGIVRNFGYQLGMCFQLADDILDAGQNEKQNMVSLLGKKACQNMLLQLTEQCRQTLQVVALPSQQSPSHFFQFLDELILSNSQRKK